MGAASDLAAFFDNMRSGLGMSTTIDSNGVPYGMTDAQKQPVYTSSPVVTPAGVQAKVTAYPTAPGVSTSANAARDARQKEMNNNVWSNDPTAAVLEAKSWAIYVETGRWDSPEQKQYHDQAEALRKGLNPMYPGSSDGGTENKYILPTDQFVTSNGMDTKGLLTYGGLALGAVMVLSMFRR